MKTISGTGMLFASIFFISSCVTPEKLAKVEEENDASRKEARDLQLKNIELVRTNDSLVRLFTWAQKISNEQLQLKQKELDLNSKQLEKNQRMMNELQKEVRLEQDEMRTMQQDISKALKAFSPDELSVKMRDGELYVSMSDKLLFPTGSDEINKRGKKALQLISDVLKRTSMLIMVEGHTDAVPINNRIFKDNWDLSVHRATTVTRVLTENGIKPSRIIASGRSEFHPVASNSSEKGRKFNRRTEIALLPRLDKLKTILMQDNNSQALNQKSLFEPLIK